MSGTYKRPLDIPVSSGLDLANPAATLELGRLIQAKNKAPGVWGPRHGCSFVDKASRGRAHAQLNGSSSYLYIPYNSVQLDLGLHFSILILLKVLSLPGTGEDEHILGANNATRGPVDIYIDDGGLITFKLYDGSTTTTLTSITAISANDIVAIWVVRDENIGRLYILNTSNNVGPVQEDVDTSISSTNSLVVVTEDWWIGKRPAYHSGSGSGYLNAVFGGMYIRKGPQTSGTHAIAELPNPRSRDVVGAWTGELLESDTVIYDASRTSVYMIADSVTQASKIADVVEPVQGMGYSTTMDGRLRNTVAVGGRLYAEIV